jgi:hypothetical protein
MTEISQHLKEKPAVAAGWLISLIRRRFLLLFLFLLFSLFLYPYAESTAFGYVAFRFAGSTAIVLSVYAVSRRRAVVFWGLLLAVPAIIQYLRLVRYDVSVFSLSNISLSFVFDIFIITVMFRRVFSSERPNSETVFGALCIYLMIGFSFTSVYELIERLRPHSFYLAPFSNTHTVLDRFDFIYYSFGTMTGLGAAGVTAISNQARSLTVMESILGVLYLAVLISRLMGAYRIPAGTSTEP